jgi:CTP synthase (UTP-ammonia lyase)
MVVTILKDVLYEYSDQEILLEVRGLVSEVSSATFISVIAQLRIDFYYLNTLCFSIFGFVNTFKDRKRKHNIKPLHAILQHLVRSLLLYGVHATYILDNVWQLLAVSFRSSAQPLAAFAH